MSDKERLLALLKDFGVTPSTELNPGPDFDSVYLRALDGEVDGYSGFFVAFSFRPEDGSFVSVGVWE